MNSNPAKEGVVHPAKTQRGIRSPHGGLPRPSINDRTIHPAPWCAWTNQTSSFPLKFALLFPPGVGQVRRGDGEWKRNGVADIFVFVEQLKGRRFVSVTGTRGAVDWAHQVKELLTVRYAQVPRVRLVMDNLNTHDTSSSYKAFPAEESRALAERLEIHHTPKHGSWLNVAECDLSTISRQCLDRRIPAIGVMRREVMNWTTDRNNRAAKVDWQFTAKDGT